MTASRESFVRLALPSKGELDKPTMDFLAACGLAVFRPNDRQYVATIPAIPEITVLFQRVVDIVGKVDEGTVDFGITGLDVVGERGESHEDVVLMYENLGYGGCELVLAVPDSWVDVSAAEDLADLAVIFKERGRILRIATKYPNLTRKWLYERSIVHFSMVEAEGALEAAPSMGFADMIADISASGTTLRENRLKRIAGGTILKSQACLVANKRLLLADPAKQQVARKLLEYVEAHLRAKKYVSITANIRGESPDAIGLSLSRERNLAGLRGPTIARVYPQGREDGNWYTLTVVVERGLLMEVIDHLRKAGATDIAVTRLDYVFDAKSWSYHSFIERLKRGK